MIVEISTHGSTLKRDHDSFLISSQEGKSEIPAEKVDAIIISANALISTQAIRLAIEKQIHIVVADWSGNPFARVWVSSQGRATDHRRLQYLNQNTIIGLRISTDIVTRKIIRQRKILLDLKNNRKKQISELEDAVSTLKEILEKLREENEQLTKERLLGLEGWCAKKYFRAVSAVLPERWKFEERSQHPAKDEFNAALNYIYGMGYSGVEKIIVLSGLDPNAGFYHADSYGKPTLSYDIMELVRPLMDQSIVSLFTKKIVREDWFERQEKGNGGVFLAKKGRMSIVKKYIEENKKLIEKESWDYCKKIIKMIGGQRV